MKLQVALQMQTLQKQAVYIRVCHNKKLKVFRSKLRHLKGKKLSVDFVYINIDQALNQ